MQIANCQVFTLLVVVGLLMFFSSFLTLDLHTSVEELKKLPGHEFFHAPRVRSSSFLDATHNLQDFKKEESIAAALSNRFNEGLHQAAAGHLVTDQNSPAQTQDNLANKQCSVTFQPKCRINPLVKYWDEVMECYTSPLRKFHGLSAPKEKQKFVVFQPDAGGWNNIRMALEVVILFAQVSQSPGRFCEHKSTCCVRLCSQPPSANWPVYSLSCALLSAVPSVPVTLTTDLDMFYCTCP